MISMMFLGEMIRFFGVFPMFSALKSVKKAKIGFRIKHTKYYIIKNYMYNHPLTASVSSFP